MTREIDNNIHSKQLTQGVMYRLLFRISLALHLKTFKNKIISN